MSMRDLLRARSELPLEALELGPLIGRGSFGRVYKGATLRQLCAAPLLQTLVSVIYAPEGCPSILTGEAVRMHPAADLSQLPWCQVAVALSCLIFS